MRTAFLLATILGLVAAPTSAQAQAAPCCGILAIDAGTGVVTAQVTANGSTFQFKVADTRVLRSLRVGQGVYANFSARQVSLDGTRSCCAITSGPTAAAPAPTARTPVPATLPPPPPPAPAVVPVAPPARQPAAPPAPTAQLGNKTAITAAMINTMPTVTIGAPTPRATTPTRRTSRLDVIQVPIQKAGRGSSATIVHLRGLKAVEEAPGLPDGAKRLLKMLVRRVPLDQSDNYIVDIEMAKEWIVAHGVPDNVKPTEPAEKKCGNWYDSWDCANQAANDEWKRTFDHATNEWENATKTLADAWETSLECFTERTISAGDIPVKFSITPSMTVNLSQSGSRGSAQEGTVAGSATLGIPMQSDVTARLELFYIPCLPFAIRPKALSGVGVLTVGQELTTTVSATGSFNKTFTIPPTGGPSIPIQVFPIIIGGVPVAVLDVSAYIEGEIEVSAEGRAEGRFQIKNSNPTQFSFGCSGKGCTARSTRQPAATTTNQSAQIEGTVSVKPAIYVALELNFNYEALSARAGPQPYLKGTASGCAAVAGSQTAGGPSTVQENHVLSADLDWGVELRAEALVLGKIVGESYRTPLMADKHIWFRDLAPGGSNALMATVEAAGPAVAGQPTDHTVKMPTCYPYPNRVKYQVTWTGGALPAPDRPGVARNTACTWQAAQGTGTCTFDPAKEFVISLIWPTPGPWSLTVAPVGDAHDRVFTPAPTPTQLTVTVVP